MKRSRASQFIVGLGLLFVGILLAELIALTVSPERLAAVAVVNYIASLPFLVILIGGGYLLWNEDISRDRHPRIVGWTVLILVFFVVFFFLIAIFTQDNFLVRVGIVRWAASAGAGMGALVGVFEARAIERAIAAERTRIRNEELQRQNNYLEEFTKTISHDLRNPLNVASGYIELLKGEYDDEELDKVSTAHDRMEQIIGELLHLARSGQLIDEPETVPLSTLVEECWSNVETNEATLKFGTMSGIIADSTRLRHLFENLFRNAIEHGGADATVRVGMLQNGFYVEDDGPGIPEGDRETVFQNGYSTKQGGTGLGLSIARQTAEAHGWKVRVTAGTDGGARFEITGVDVGHSPETSTASNVAV